MSLTYSFAKPRDVFDKLKRDAAAIEDEVTGDRVFSFVVTGWHIWDWVKQGLTEAEQKREYDNVISKEEVILVCRDLATASKHAQVTPKSGASSATSSQGGYGQARYGKGGYGVGEEEVIITFNDGRVLNVLDLKDGVVTFWEQYLSSRGL